MDAVGVSGGGGGGDAGAVFGGGILDGLDACAGWGGLASPCDDGELCAWLGLGRVRGRVDWHAGIALFFSVGVAGGNGFVCLVFSGGAAGRATVAVVEVPDIRADDWNGGGDGDDSLSQLYGFDGEGWDLGLALGLADVLPQLKSEESVNEKCRVVEEVFGARP